MTVAKEQIRQIISENNLTASQRSTPSSVNRNGEFEPKLIPKYQRNISGIEDKVISLYARGMSIWDIHDQSRTTCMGLSCLRR